MSSQLLKFLAEHHCINAENINIDDSNEMLDETVKRIDEHQSTDIDIEVCKLLESDLMENFARALVMREKTDAFSVFIELEKLSESNLKELISDLLRAG